MKQIITLFLFFILTICLRPSIYGQVGTPFIKNYSPKDYKQPETTSPQNWAVVADKRDLIYVANTSGILEYDGVKWRMVKGTATENIGSTQSLALDSTGRLYIGSANDWGYLITNKNGLLHYVSLQKDIPAKDIVFADLFDISATKNAVYFATSKALYRWANNCIKAWPTTHEYVRAFVNNGEYYIREQLSPDQKQNRLLQIRGEALIPVLQKTGIADKAINYLLPYGSNTTLVVTAKEGFYLLEGNNAKRFNTEADIYLKAQILRKCIALNNSCYTVATRNGGLVIIDSTGKTVSIIDKYSGLQDNLVIKPFVDKQSGIWMGLNVGVSRVEMPAPLSVYGDEVGGVKGIVMAILSANGRLYAATTGGTFYLQTALNSFEKPHFVPVKGINGQSFHLLQTPAGVLAATVNGVFLIKGTEAKLLVSGITQSLERSIMDSNRIYVGLEKGIESLYFTGHEYKLEQILSGIDETVRKIVEYKYNLWLYAEEKGLIQVDINNGFNSKSPINKYFDNAIFPKGSVIPYLIDKKLFFGTSKGFWSYNGNRKTYYRDTLSPLGKQFKNTVISNIYESIKGNLWFNSGNNLVGQLLKKPHDSGFIYDTVPALRLMGSSIWCMYEDERGVAWYGTNDGIVRYDSKVKKNYSITYNTLIRRVALTHDSVIFSGAYPNTNGNTSLTQPDSLKPKLNYSNNSIAFEFAATFFDNEAATQYSYYLEGDEKGWSEWVNKTSKEYTNLSEGKYIFHARAKNIYGNISTTATYEFSIRPPFYRTTWAYGSYFILFIGFVWLLVRLNTRRLKIKQRKLEAIIKERTAEISRQHEEISTQNKEITASIKYAKRIQDAMLPLAEDIRKLLPKSFVLYNPRDIVSGDYYWMDPKDGKILVAAVDCTGHGVPGAFMSIMGHNLLTQIVNEKGHTQPSLILDALNQGVSKMLHQQADGSTVKDGMDLSFCTIDPVKMILQYAGAYNPLWLIRNNEIIETKADKFPIGMVTENGIPKKFTNHEIPLQPGDTIYLFSDGYADQFGGPDGKKLKYKPFKDLLITIHQKPMEEQKKILSDYFDQWKGTLEQVDDVLIIGFKL